MDTVEVFRDNGVEQLAAILRGEPTGGFIEDTVGNRLTAVGRAGLLGVGRRLVFEFAAPARDLPDVFEHFEVEHPGVEVSCRVWWDIPYVHSADSRGIGTLTVNASAGKSGDLDGPETWFCGECDADLAVPDSDMVEYI